MTRLRDERLGSRIELATRAGLDSEALRQRRWTIWAGAFTALLQCHPAIRPDRSRDATARRARHEHQQGRERSQVNEILKQLEAYEGWFCAATNWAAGLDPAVQRRFDFKFAFQWLDETQRRLMVEDYCTRLGITRTLSTDALTHALADLRHLLPGDLAALCRRIAMSDNVSDRDLLAWARAEVALKPEARMRPMGFTRAA